MNFKIINIIWNQWHIVIIFIGICIGAFILSLAARCLLKKIMHLPSNFKNRNIALLGKIWQKTLIIIFLFLLYFAEPFLSLPKNYSGYYFHFLTLLVVSFLTWSAIQLLYAIHKQMIKKVEKTSTDNLNLRSLRTKLNILFKISISVLGIIGIAIALMTFPKIKQLGVSILASAGLAGIIIGFAAQKSLSNILAGIQIAFTQPIRIDDVVIVEGEWGNIEEITLTYVVIRIWDKRRLVVPITYFIENIFQNWTRNSSELIGTVFLQLDYIASVNEIRDALDTILETTPLWDKKVKNICLTDTTPRTIELRVLISAVDSSTLWELRCYVREQLITFLQKNHPDYLPKTRLEINDQKLGQKP